MRWWACRLFGRSVVRSFGPGPEGGQDQQPKTSRKHEGGAMQRTPHEVAGRASTAALGRWGALVLRSGWN